HTTGKVSRNASVREIRTLLRWTASRTMAATPSSAMNAASAPSSSSSSARRNAVCTSRSAGIGTSERSGDVRRDARLPQQDRERRQRLVPFDEARHHAAALERMAVELPDGRRDRRAVVVDEQELAAAHDAGMAGEVDLADGGRRQRVEISAGVAAEVGA